jgi:hydroxyacylglutathione hydrolase
MNLEDHLGDIVRKARNMSGVSTDAAAQAAGLTLEQLGALESTGVAPANTNLAVLANAVGLNAAKLESVAKGWVPSPKDLSVWCELRWVITDAGMAVNSYLVWDEVSREAALFDTGWTSAPVQAIIAENQLQLRHIFITHSHEDHIAALDEVRKAYPKARLHSSARTRGGGSTESRQ